MRLRQRPFESLSVWWHRDERQVAGLGEGFHVQGRGRAADDFGIRAPHGIGDLGKGGVVPDQKSDRQRLINGGAQLARTELKPAVTDQANDLRVGRCNRSPDRSAWAKAKRAESGRGVELAAKIGRAHV